MKLLLTLALLAAAYAYFMMHTMDIVAGQAQHINTTYQYVSANADHIATGR